MISINIKGMNIEISPEVLYIFEDVRKFKSIATCKLAYPVVGSAMVKYNNPLGIKYARVHNVYSESDEYFIDMFGEKVILGDIENYEIKNPNMPASRYSIYNEIKFNTNLK